MKVVALSDLHGILPNMDKYEADLVCVCGDITPTRNHEVGFQFNWLITEFYPWCQHIPARQIVWISGNHDKVCQESYVPGFLNSGRIRYLQDNFTIFEGLKIYGFPWTPAYGHWSFGADENTLARKASVICDDTDILLSHGPPFGTFDLVPRRTITEENETEWPLGEHTGSKALAERILQLRNNRLKLACVGHIHEQRGRMTYNDIPGKTFTLANVTILDERYEHKYSPMVFEI